MLVVVEVVMMVLMRILVSNIGIKGSNDGSDGCFGFTDDVSCCSHW